MEKLHGGYPIYGADIGVLMLNCRFPRPKGDIGNAATFPYPICYEIVDGPETAALTMDGEEAAVEQMLQSAEHLEQKGVRAIFTSCGLLISYQDSLTKRLSIPVISSCLAILPFVQSIIGSNQRIGIIVSAINGGIQRLLEKPENKNVVPISMEDSPEFMQSIMSMHPPFELDQEKLQREVVEICREKLRQHSDLRAIIVECTNIAPYSAQLRRALKIPVFDIIQIVNLLHTAVSMEF